MTTYNIDGPITEIVTTPASTPFVTLSCDTIISGLGPTTIERAGKEMVAIVSYTASTTEAPAGFALSPDFLVGDVVEVYMLPGSYSAVDIHDENGHSVGGVPTNGAPNTGRGIRLRKLSTGNSWNWGIVNA